MEVIIEYEDQSTSYSNLYYNGLGRASCAMDCEQHKLHILQRVRGFGNSANRLQCRTVYDVNFLIA